MSTKKQQLDLTASGYKQLFRRIEQSNLSKDDQKTIITLIKGSMEYLIADTMTDFELPDLDDFSLQLPTTEEKQHKR